MKRGISIVIFGILLILLVQSVSALDACCEVTKDGDYCRYTDEDNCAADSKSTYATCEQTSYCEIGCCYSSDSGSCYKSTAKARCESIEDTTWTDSDSCEISQCELGCCMLADQAFFVTEVKCKETASQYEGLEMIFDDEVNTEYDCLNAVKNQEFGCCIEGEDYTFTTREGCSTSGQEIGTNITEIGFQAGMLCSNDLLSGACAKQQYTGCYQGKIYWFDSCGNRENIYSKDKSASYNQGYVLDEDFSCVINGPYDDDCGNCDYANGNVCGEDVDGVMDSGDYTCIDLNCYETYEDDVSPVSGGDKLNGESWCIYDSFTGQAQDTAGSRQFRHLCVNGQEITEPCTDYREEICIHGVLNAEVLGTLEALRLSDGNDYVEAACRDNRWEECNDCNSLNSGDEIYDCCTNEDYRDCYWLEGEVTRIDRGTNLPRNNAYKENEEVEFEEMVGGTCVAQVPPGLEFWSDEGEVGEEQDISNQICSQANAECTATWRIGGFKKVFGGKTNPKSWNLVEESPTGCTEREWLVSQNTLCKAQGDCGAYYNFAGDASYDGFTSNMMDESFFFDHGKLENEDIADWDYLINMGGGEISYYGAKSRYFYENPAFTLAIVGSSVGAASNLVACTKSNEAGLLSSFNSMDSGALQNIMGAGTTLSKGAGLLGTKNQATGFLIAVEEYTGCPLTLQSATTTGTSEEEARILSEEYGTLADTYKDCAERALEADYEEAETYLSMSGEYEIRSLKYKEIADNFENVEPEVVPLSGEVEDPEGEREDPGDPIVEGVLEKIIIEDEPCGDCNTEKDCDSSEEGFFTCENTCCVTTDKGNEQLSTIAQKDSTPLSLTQGLGCFMTGATPVVGLFGNPLGQKYSADDVGSLLGSSNSLVQQFGKTVQQAKGAKTTSRVANGFTIIMVAYLAVEYGLDNETTITYTTDCKMWQPPTGGDNCELCNSDDKPCSEYRCRSLGAACELLNEGTSSETCSSVNVNDVNSPVISPNEEILSTDFTIRPVTEEGNKGFEINELIPPFTPVQLGLATDEPAICKYDTQPGTEFEDMIYDFGESLYIYNHALLLSLGKEATEEEIMALTEGKYTMYVKCQDANGNNNERDYFIRFLVDDTPDLTPPTIMFTSVDDGTYFAYGVNETTFSVYLNEPSVCKWSEDDSSYGVMDGEMDCASSSYEGVDDYYGTYPCTTVLEGVTENELNYFYFRCQDLAGNINEDSYKYSTKASDESLVLVSLSPEGVQYNDTISLEVETEGGAENGVATCGFSFDSEDYEDMTLFYETSASSHVQELNLYEGDYTINVVCRDVAGNQVENTTELSIEVDESGPSISNFYVDEVFVSIVLEMNEDSFCEYSSSPFDFGEGVKMSGDGTMVHESGISLPVYYVKCEDTRGNEGSFILDISLWS